MQNIKAGLSVGRGIKSPATAQPKPKVANEGSKPAEITPTSGAENAATYPKLKNDLIQQNLNNIAKQDPRLTIAVKGDGSSNPNFSVGKGTATEADRLGKIWVGDGGKLVENQKKCPGCWVSADGSLVYRPPSPKKSRFATTGVQANFQILDKSGAVISNGHLNITK